MRKICTNLYLKAINAGNKSSEPRFLTGFLRLSRGLKKKKPCNLLNRMKIMVLIFIFAVVSGGLYAQHLFSVDYGNLSGENAKRLKTQIAGSEVSTLSLMRNNENKDEYLFSVSTAQNTKIVILNEETGNNVVITPTKEVQEQFRLAPFFIEELRQSVLGDADRYLVLETCADFSVRNAASVSAATRKVFIPRYLYGTKEDVKEALPKDRQIIHIFKEKPRLIHIFDDPEGLEYIARIEEEMSYYVYMYQLPDGTLIIYNEHFNPCEDKNEIRTGTNLQFNLSGLTGQAQTATLHALNLWSEQMAGTIPVDINITQVSGVGWLGASYRQPNWFNTANNTWYCSALGNQLLGYNFAPSMRDIRLEMNTGDYSWYYSSTGTPSGSQYDWITVMLHEVCHGLGFYPLVGSNGAYTYTTNTGGSQTTAYPGIYDRQLYEGLTGACLTDLSQTQRAQLVTSNNLYSGSPSSNLLFANDGTRVRMYAPTTWASGSSVSHWDTSVSFPTFMKYAYQNKLHTINPREIAIMLDMGWTQPTNTDWYTANPNATSFTISTAAQLAGLAQIVNATTGSFANEQFLNKTITLANDVNIASYGANYNNGAGWVPIGNGGGPCFQGVFDGNGKKITGLYINNLTGLSNVGLFGFVADPYGLNRAEVKNLGVEGANVTSYRNVDYVGIIIGRLENGLISNCNSTGLVSSPDWVGGLVGIINNSTVTNCYSKATVISMATAK